MTRQEIKETVWEALNEYFSNNKVVTISEAARLLKKSRPTIYKMVKRGELEITQNQITLKSIYNYGTRTR